MAFGEQALEAVSRWWRSRGRGAAARHSGWEQVPLHATGSVRLSAAEARSGTTRRINYRIRELCTRCQGLGRTGDSPCAICASTGLRWRATRKSVKVRIPAGTGEGSTIEIRGRGVPGAGSRPTGHLRLTVHAPTAAQPRRAAAEGGTVTRGRVQVILTTAGFEVRTNCGGAQPRWQTDLQLPWPSLTRMVFAASGHDPIVALHITTTTGQRLHAIDARQLTSSDWRDIAHHITELTDHRLTLDLADLDRSPYTPDA